MKKLGAITLALVLLLSLAVSIPAAAQQPPWPPEFAAAHCKITGGTEGWYRYNFEEKHRISFGLTAISTGLPFIQHRDYGDVVFWPAKGEFHLVDHTTKEKVSGYIKNIIREEPTPPPKPRRLAEGKCTFDGNQYHLAVEVLDAGEPGVKDFVRIELIKPGIPGEPVNIIHTWVGRLEGGNIQIKHKGPKVPLDGSP